MPTACRLECSTARWLRDVGRLPPACHAPLSVPVDHQLSTLGYRLSRRLSVFLGAHTRFTKQNRNTFATALANLVAANIPAHNNPTELENDWDDERGFPFEIHLVSIWRLPLLTRNHWTVGPFGLIRENFAQTLQEVISKKEAPIRGYDTGCAALWLLIVAEHSSPSAFFDPSESTLSHPYVSSFDRVFFLELSKRKAFELRIAE